MMNKILSALCLTVGMGVSMSFTGCQQKAPHTFMSYNVHNCIGMDGVTDFVRVGEIVKGMNPEVVAIQEVDSVTGRNPVYVLEEIGKTAGMYASYGPAIRFNGGKYGIGILSKEKPLNFYTVALPGREEKRALLVAEFEKYVFCCVHLSLTEEDQYASISMIQKELAKFQKPVFIGGDFNAHPDSRTIQAMAEKAVALTDTTVFTYPSDKAGECIDYLFQMNGKESAEVLKSGNVKTADVAVASDHFPIFATVKF